MMHANGHNSQKPFMDYIKLSTDEIAEEIDVIANEKKEEVFCFWFCRKNLLNLRQNHLIFCEYS